MVRKVVIEEILPEQGSENLQVCQVGLMEGKAFRMEGIAIAK